MSKCQRCHGKIKKSSIHEYNGKIYSLQCFRKVKIEEKENLPPTFSDIAKDLLQDVKVTTKQFTIKSIYHHAFNKEEFAKLYAVPNHLVNHYYDKYLIRAINEITL